METDKASIEVPSPQAGVIKEIKVKVGDKVSEGSVLLTLAVAEQSTAPADSKIASETSQKAEAAATVAPPPAATAEAIAPQSIPSGDKHAEVVVLGAGPGGYTAAFRAADLGKKVILIERYATLGGVCLNVGCIPSKALLHTAKVITEAEEVEALGIVFAKPKIDIDKLRTWKESVIGKLTKGLKALAKQRKVETIHGTGKFVTPHLIQIETAEGQKTVSFDHCIIAATSISITGTSLKSPMSGIFISTTCIIAAFGVD